MNSLTIVIACKKVDEKMILVRSSVVRGNPPPLLRGLDSSMAQSKWEQPLPTSTVHIQHSKQRDGTKKMYSASGYP